MPHSQFLKEGSYNAVCSMCNGTFKATELRRHWQGQYRCKRCWEPRNAQDFVRAGPPERMPPWTQPETSEFIENVCTFEQRASTPGYGGPGCTIPGFDPPSLQRTYGLGTGWPYKPYSYYFIPFSNTNTWQTSGGTFITADPLDDFTSTFLGYIRVTHPIPSLRNILNLYVDGTNMGSQPGQYWFDTFKLYLGSTELVSLSRSNATFYGPGTSMPGLGALGTYMNGWSWSGVSLESVGASSIYNFVLS